MEFPNQATDTKSAASEVAAQRANVATTTTQHPKLPAGSSLIEKIALPMVFSVITAVVKDPQHAAALQEYMLALRDAINTAYPDAA